MINNKDYYIGVDKANNNADIFSTKTGVAEYLGISTQTIRRHLKNNSFINNSNYSIYISNGIKRCRKGFAIK